jgi:hypothetical protein
MIYFYFRSKSKKPKNKMIEVIYMERRYKMDLSYVDKIELNRNIALANSFIFTIFIIIMNVIDNFIIKTVVSFVVLFVLIWILYSIIGNMYKKKMK